MTPRLQRFALALLLPCAVIAGCSKDPQVLRQEYVASGDQYVARKQYQEAIVEYRNALQHDPKSGEARKKLAGAYARAGDGEAAAREYLKAAELLPNDLRVQVTVGQMELLSGDFAGAKARADRLLSHSPRSVEALILRANALAGLKDLTAAVTQIQQAIDYDPERTTTYTNLGTLQLARGHAEEAERAFRRAVAMAPHSVTARLALTNFFWSAGREKEAEDNLKQAVSSSGKDPTIDRALAMLYLAMGRVADAEPYLVRAAETAQDGDSKIALAEYYVIAEREAEALRLLETVAAADEASAGVAVARIAEIYMQQGRDREAIRRLDDLLARRPKNTTALMAKARLRLAQHDVDAALEPARVAVTVDPNSLPARLNLARVHVGRGVLDDAVKAYSDALALEPTNVPAHLELARVQLAAGRVKEALQLAERALDLEPDSVDAQLVRAEALADADRSKEADTVLHELGERYDDSADVQTQLGSLYASRDRTGPARQAYTRALGIDPFHAGAHTGLAALDFAEGHGERVRARVESALAKRPNDVGLLLLSARAAVELRDFDRAEQRLSRIIEIDQSNLQAYGLLGQIFAAQGRLADATRQFERIVGLRPRAVAPSTVLGMLLERQGRDSDAMKRYRAVLDIDPKSAVASNNLAWLIVKNGGDLNTALRLARTAHSSLRDRAEVNHTLGWIHYRKGSLGEAVPLLRVAAEKQPTNARYRLHLGLAYAHSGSDRNACEALSAALRLDPQVDGAAEARNVGARLPECGLAPTAPVSPQETRVSRLGPLPR